MNDKKNGSCLKDWRKCINVTLIAFCPHKRNWQKRLKTKLVFSLLPFLGGFEPPAFRLGAVARQDKSCKAILKKVNKINGFEHFNVNSR